MAITYVGTQSQLIAAGAATPDMFQRTRRGYIKNATRLHRTYRTPTAAQPDRVRLERSESHAVAFGLPGVAELLSAMQAAGVDAQELPPPNVTGGGPGKHQTHQGAEVLQLDGIRRSKRPAYSGPAQVIWLATCKPVTPQQQLVLSEGPSPRGAA